MSTLHNHSLVEAMDDGLFENRGILMRPHQVAKELNISVKTVYNWKYRGHLSGVPKGLFLKFGRLLFVRVDVLRLWMKTQNSTGFEV